MFMTASCGVRGGVLPPQGLWRHCSSAALTIPHYTVSPVMDQTLVTSVLQLPITHTGAHAIADFQGIHCFSPWQYKIDSN